MPRRQQTLEICRPQFNLRPIRRLIAGPPFVCARRLRLTIDIKLQRAAEQALRYGINLARVSGIEGRHEDGGAIVALDPKDGSILALASAPTYEPSVFAGHVSTKALANQGLTQQSAAKKNFPSLNRASISSSSFGRTSSGALLRSGDAR